MKINLGALGLTIAVLFLAVSILTVGSVHREKNIETGATDSYCKDRY